MKQKFNKSKDRVTNDKTYRTMKNRLEKDFSGRYVVIADGKFLGAEDSLEDAWAIASPFESAIVARITKKPLRARILGSSLVTIDVDSSGDDAHHECDNRRDYEHN